MRAKKIVLSVNAAWNVANFRLGLIAALQAAGHEITVLAPADDSCAAIQAAGIRFRALPMDRKGVSPLADAGLYLRYRHALAELRPDVFLGYTVKPNIYGSLAAQALGIRVINNVSGLGTAFIRGGMLTRIVSGLYRTAFRRSERVFFQNPDDRALFLNRGLLPEAKTALLPGSGIDLTRFAAAPQPSGADGLAFLMVARLLRDKGVVEYVEAARLARAERTDLRFRLLGFLDPDNRTGIDRAQLDGWIGEGIIDYLGAAEDVRPHIKAADAIVLPSYREGLPRTLLEGAAMARPLIATDVPGCREPVAEGENGFLCAVRDPVSLAQAALRFAALSPAERAAMGTASRRIAEERYNEQIIANAYLAAIAAAGPARR
jgi:glycosyltransferase involved in cell wall biosynthesis